MKKVILPAIASISAALCVTSAWAVEPDPLKAETTTTTTTTNQEVTPVVINDRPERSDRGDGDLDQLGRVAVFIGAKFLDDEEWDPIETQAEVGVLFDYGVEDWPVSISLNGMVSGMSKDSVRGTTAELQIGVSKIWRPEDGGFSFSVGAGPEIVGAAYRVSGQDTDYDLGFGFWVSAAAYWQLPQGFFIGPMVSYSHATISVNDDDIDAGGLHAGLAAGYGW